MNANADREKKTRLQVQIRLFRDGRPAYEGPINRLDDDGQQDPKVVVTDALAKEKYRMATQAIDFEVQ